MLMNLRFTNQILLTLIGLHQLQYLLEQFLNPLLFLEYMDDIQAPPVGTLGTVKGVDDIGSIMVRWDNGSSLSIVCGYDRCTESLG